ncbi:MAG: glycosyltransferase family 4 protein [Rhizobiales bacterium]|nr:glycosyltransferase family 4 protein [Hyphomicrobiales bacterium]
MRIAFHAPLKPPDHPVASGDRAMARALISALQRSGHDVVVVSRLRSYDSGDPDRQARMGALGARLAERLLRRFRRGGWMPDLWFTYHLYHKAPDWLGPQVTARLGIPYLLVEASFAPKQANGPWAIGHRAVEAALRHADRVFQPNPADNECVLPLLRSTDRLVPLKPFLETAPFRATERDESRRDMAAAFGIDPCAPWLLTVAMMRHDQKLLSYRTLASALASLTDLAWILIVAGVGSAEAEVRSAFAPLGRRVHWVGMLDRERLIRLYRSADLFVWPAIKEAWGMALLEAQAAGLPVVAGRSGGVAAVVADSESGLLAPEGDAVAFANAVRELLLDPERRANMGRAAAARIAREHDIGVAAAFFDRQLRALTRDPVG